MKKIDILSLMNLMGGKVIHANWCAAMQNTANENGHNWTPEFWDEWATVYEQNGCLHAVVTPENLKSNK